MSIPLFLSLCMQYSWDLTSHLLQSRMRRSRTKPYAHITPAAAPESCKRAARASPCQPGLVEINSASCPLPHLPAPGWVPHSPPCSSLAVGIAHDSTWQRSNSKALSHPSRLVYSNPFYAQLSIRMQFGDFPGGPVAKIQILMQGTEI